MPVSGVINFSINGTVLTNQPSGIHEKFPQWVEHSTLSGKRVIVESNTGPTVEAVWGVDAARADVISELRNRRSANGSVLIAYLNASGSAAARYCYMPSIDYEQFLITHAVSQLTVQFLQL